MDPDLRFFNERANKGCADTGTRAAGTAIFDIRIVRFNLLEVSVIERQLPDGFIRCLRRCGDIIDQLLMSSEDAGIVIAQGTSDGTSQGRNVDQHSRRIGFLRVVNGVRQHKPAFSIGRPNLDCRT